MFHHHLVAGLFLVAGLSLNASFIYSADATKAYNGSNAASNDASVSTEPVYELAQDNIDIADAYIYYRTMSYTKHGFFFKNEIPSAEDDCFRVKFNQYKQPVEIYITSNGLERPLFILHYNFDNTKVINGFRGQLEARFYFDDQNTLKKITYYNTHHVVEEYWIFKYEGKDKNLASEAVIYNRNGQVVLTIKYKYTDDDKKNIARQEFYDRFQNLESILYFDSDGKKLYAEFFGKNNQILYTIRFQKKEESSTVNGENSSTRLSTP